MATKNKIEVLIGGKIYTLSGYESKEYLQQVGGYLNTKIAEIRQIDGYMRLSPDMKSLLLNLNTADDYFKLKKQADELSEKVAAKDRELYDIKHELIQLQMKYEAAQKALAAAQDAQKESQKRIIQLETRLDNRGVKR